MNPMKRMKSTSKKTQRTLSVVLAAVMAFTGIGIGVGCSKKANESATGNSVVQPVDDFDLELFSDFDIENEEEVEKRAEAIYEISEKDYTVDQIKNLIYIANAEYENIEFSSTSKTDVQKFEELQMYITGLNNKKTNSLFDDNIADEVNQGAKIKAGDTTSTLDSSDKYEYSYMLDATKDEEKELAGKLAVIVNDQKQLLESNATKDKLEENADKYYEVVKSIYDNKKNYSDNFVWNIDNQISDQNPLFTMFLSKAKVKYLDKKHFDMYSNNELGNAIAEAKDLDVSELEGCKAETMPTGNHYDKEGLAGYNQNQEDHDIPKEKQKTEKGEHVRYETVTESHQEYTTRVEITTGIPESAKDDNGKTTTKHSESVSKGGEVVSTTKKVVTDPAINTTKPSKPTTTKPTTTEHEDEIVMSPEEYEEFIKSGAIQNVGNAEEKNKEGKTLLAYLIATGSVALTAVAAKFIDRDLGKKGKRKKLK